MRLRTLLRALASVALGCAASTLTMVAPAAAQDSEWPARAVKVIVPYGAGSTPDYAARIIADRLQRRFGKPFVVENKPGASGMLGTDLVAKATPDGYTIGVAIAGPLSTNTLLYRKMPYDPGRDLVPLTQLVSQPSVLVVHPDVPAATLKELIVELKRRPGQYNYASFGNGSISHLTMELLASKSGTRMVQVPYPGSPQAVAAVVSGDTPIACLPAAAVMPQVRAGKLRALAQTLPKRSKLLPDLPTMIEEGMADVQADAWIGMFVPTGTPKVAQEALAREAALAVGQVDTLDAFHAQMMEPVGSKPADFVHMMRDELRRWKPVIEHNKILLD
jgi:tripartite-type tricarboxylate transporter receptor subunit TctC